MADSTPESGRSPGGERGNPLQCSCLENPMDRGAWRAAVPGVAESRTRPSDLVLGQLVHLAVQQRLTQHGKAAMLQQKLILKNI